MDCSSSPERRTSSRTATAPRATAVVFSKRVPDRRNGVRRPATTATRRWFVDMPLF
jgi:hypothetical protein